MDLDALLQQYRDAGIPVKTADQLEPGDACKHPGYGVVVVILVNTLPTGEIEVLHRLSTGRTEITTCEPKQVFEVIE